MFSLPVRSGHAFLLAAGFALLLLSGNASARTVNLAWDAPSSYSPAGYKVHYGKKSGQYTASIDVGNQTSYSVSGLQGGITYYFVVTAYDANRSSESSFSNEVAIDAAGKVVPPPLVASAVKKPAGAKANPNSPQCSDNPPTLDSIATPQSVHVGQVLKIFATAVDSDGDKVAIRVSGKPKNAKFTQGYNAGFQKQEGKLEFQPRKGQINKSFELVFSAKEAPGKGKCRQTSQPRTVNITVLPALADAGVAASTPSITRISIASAKYHPKQKAIIVTGRLHTQVGVTKQERKSIFYGREVSLIDSASSGVMGTTTADGAGKFTLRIPVDDRNKAACFVEVETSGYRGKPRAVKGLAHCM